ncbi:HTH-type transcriptional regulatory protein GabR [Massilia sp. Bi118]|uniref:MocR-like pyridoxine biosynthesis transcription factor PdxR n=1 Tax=Massilia sp. Bi118 TaxID=2822346 RepID=UPI001D8CFB8B|nr:PLP-dependent aminotransferase family protein [Massilia sp. Bi118]CAH0206647.1 HTH-type transcriptional regulatory protein GabR [Massilia sp. Bi118]
MHVHDILAAIPLERTSATPLFRQLYLQLKEAILAGGIAPSARLPATRELGRLLGVSRQTVLAAYEQLMAEGYLEGAVGKGTFVSASLPAAAKAKTSDAEAAPPLVRPLSARGEAMAAAMARVRHHEGPLRTFRISMPGLDLFPFEIWRKLEARHWRRRQVPLGYGGPAGHAPLRELLCAYLRASRGVHCVPEQIVITTGSQQALYLLAQLLLAPGEGVWLESPGYQGALAPFAVAGARICPVPVDAEGMMVAYAAQRYPDARLVFATPSHQLPLGVTMSLARRLELLRWAQAKRAWIVEDDYDSEYRYTGPPLASLQSLDRSGCVIYVGTLSKVLFPGLRLGYIVAPPALAEPLARAKAVVDRHSPIVPQAVLADFIQEGHFARHIRRTRDAYGERRIVMLEAIQARMQGALACGPSDAGLDLCVGVTNGMREAEAAARAGAEGVDVRPLSYYTNPAAGPDCAVPPGLLLGFSAFTPAQIRAGIGRLEQAIC